MLARKIFFKRIWKKIGWREGKGSRDDFCGHLSIERTSGMACLQFSWRDLWHGWRKLNTNPHESIISRWCNGCLDNNPHRTLCSISITGVRSFSGLTEKRRCFIDLRRINRVFLCFSFEFLWIIRKFVRAGINFPLERKKVFEEGF